MKNKLVRIFSWVFPKIAANIAYQKLVMPQSGRSRIKENEVLELAEKSIEVFNGFNIQTYCWKGGKSKILLIHGWEGQAGNFSSLVPLLLNIGYTVYAFDAPSHGNSSKGKTNLFEYTNLVGQLIKKYNVKQLVSHSFGGVAVTYALFKHPEIKIDSYVLFTTPDKFSERMKEVLKQNGMSLSVEKHLVDRFKTESGDDPYKLNVSEFVKKLNIGKVLILHDKHDRVIPISRSKNVQKNWKNCTLVELENTGHFRILHDSNALQHAIEFLKSTREQ
jgi:pimeloyl-ACP methyl ester carboxylesterase